MLWAIFDTTWAWLSGPPVWASTAALVVVTFSYMIWIFGDDRLIRFSRILFKKDARLAEFKKFTDDEAVIAYKKALLAKKLLETASFDHISQMPPPGSPSPDEAEITAKMRMQVYREAAMHHEEVIKNAARRLCSFAGPVDNANLEASVKKRLEVAKSSAYLAKSYWPEFENGGHFDSEAEQNRFHELRCETDEISKIIDELQASLKGVEGAWFKAIDGDTRYQLLEDFAKEMPR